MNSSFCPNCGNKVESNGQFCTNCGYNFNQNSNVNVNNINVQNTQSVNNNSNSIGIAGFIISLISLILCCGSLSWLSLILSIIGMNKAKQNNGEGHGLSLAGVIISIAGLLYVLFWLSLWFVSFVAAMNEIALI